MAEAHGTRLHGRRDEEGRARCRVLQARWGRTYLSHKLASDARPFRPPGTRRGGLFCLALPFQVHMPGLQHLGMVRGLFRSGLACGSHASRSRGSALRRKARHEGWVVFYATNRTAGAIAMPRAPVRRPMAPLFCRCFLNCFLDSLQCAVSSQPGRLLIQPLQFRCSGICSGCDLPL